MNGQSQIPTVPGSNARVSGKSNGSCTCSHQSRSSNACAVGNPKSSFPKSEFSYKSTTPYDDWSVLDSEEQNTFTAFRKKACNFIASEPEEFQINTAPRRCACGREPLYACPTLLKKAHEMIDYVPESEFLKKVKQQCQLLEYNQPNIFSAINEGIVTDSFDVEGYMEQTAKRLNDPHALTRHCRAAPDDASRQSYTPNNLNETYNVQCAMGGNYVGEGAQALNGNDENIIQPKSAQGKRSEHISRSKKPHRCRGRRKRKSGSGEAGECIVGDVFEPTLKRPHEDSCERCWRYASPPRSPVNKPEQKFDPNFRRSRSCYDFERGDADVDVPDRPRPPCRNLPGDPTKEMVHLLIPPYIPRTPSPSCSEEVPPSNFVHGTPYVMKSNQQSVSVWQKPSTAPASSQDYQHRPAEMHPSPHPTAPQRMSEMHQSPRLPIQQECTRHSVSQQKGVQGTPQPVGQQKPQVQFKNTPTNIGINFYDSPHNPPERTFVRSPVCESPVGPSCPIIYADQSRRVSRTSHVPAAEMQRISNEFKGLSVTYYKDFPEVDENLGVCTSGAVSAASTGIDNQVCSPRQASPSRVASPGLGTIPEAADSEFGQTKSPKEQSSSPKCKQMKSPKNASRQSIGSPGSSGSRRGSSGSNRGSSSSKVYSPNKSGSPKKGKPKTPSPRPSLDRTPNGVEKSPKRSPPKQKSPEADSERVKSPVEITYVKPRSPEKRPVSPDPQRSPVKTPFQEAAGSPAAHLQYDRPDHPFVRCHCRPTPTTSPDADYTPGHLVCCHCNWQQRGHRSSRNGAENPNETGPRTCRTSIEQNPKGYDSMALRCPYLRTSKGGRVDENMAPFGEAEIRVMRDYRKEPSYEDLSPIPCTPKKYVVMYMTKCKENKADEDVEVLVEELTQACPKPPDSKTQDLTEKMKRIMECPSDSMALRFQKGVSDSYKVPQSSRILYF